MSEDNLEIEAAEAWYGFWKRVLASSDMTQSWEDANPEFRLATGPFLTMGKTPKLFYRLVDASLPEDDARSYSNLFWELNGVEGIAPYVLGRDGSNLPISFVSEVPDFDDVESFQSVDQAALLWLSLVARHQALHALWMTHVAHWKEQGEATQVTFGITVGERSTLEMRAMNRNTFDPIMLMTYSIDDTTPKVAYFDGQ